MQASDFTKDAPGRLVRSHEGNLTFVPRPLPPALDYGPELAAVQSAADLAVGKLGGIGQLMANPHLLLRPFLRREAVESSRIEGLQTVLFDLIVYEADRTVAPQSPDVREVFNYVTALEYGMERLKTRPLTLNLVREMHAMLMDGVRGQELTPGEFRRRQVFIGSTSFIEDAAFVPPPREALRDGLDALEKYLHAPSDVPALARLALVHYQFEAIHPFHDGNGRLGRLLVTLLLCAYGILPKPLLYLSVYLERNRSEYYRHLLAVSQRGEWTPWVIFFLKGVAEQASDAVERSGRLMVLREDLRRRVQTAGASSRLLDLVDHLFEFPAVTPARAAQVLGLTPRQGLTNVNKLVELKIVREATGRARNRVFVCEQIVQAVEGAAPTRQSRDTRTGRGRRS